MNKNSFFSLFEINNELNDTRTLSHLHCYHTYHFAIVCDIFTVLILMHTQLKLQYIFCSLWWLPSYHSPSIHCVVFICSLSAYHCRSKSQYKGKRMPYREWQWKWIQERISVCKRDWNRSAKKGKKKNHANVNEWKREREIFYIHIYRIKRWFLFFLVQHPHWLGGIFILLSLAMERIL